MSLGIVVREARPADAASLCEAARAVAREYDFMLVSEPSELQASAYTERIQAQAKGTTKVLLVEEGGQTVAHASLYPMGLARIAHVLRLDMCVHLGHWRRGHGARLLAELLVWARDVSSTHKIELLVRSANVAAVRLYERAGFEHEGRIRDRVRGRDGTYIDDLAMGMIISRSVVS